MPNVVGCRRRYEFLRSTSLVALDWRQPSQELLTKVLYLTHYPVAEAAMLHFATLPAPVHLEELILCRSDFLDMIMPHVSSVKSLYVEGTLFMSGGAVSFKALMNLLPSE